MDKRVQQVRDELIKQYEKEIEEQGISQTVIDFVFDTQLRAKIVDMIFVLNKRIDGRAFDQIRQITVDSWSIAIYSWFCSFYAWQNASS